MKAVQSSALVISTVPVDSTSSSLNIVLRNMGSMPTSVRKTCREQRFPTGRCILFRSPARILFQMENCPQDASTSVPLKTKKKQHEAV